VTICASFLERGFTRALLAQELSPKTVLNVLVVLEGVLKHAVEWGCLDTGGVTWSRSG
jgi:hypothetical protein